MGNIVRLNRAQRQFKSAACSAAATGNQSSMCDLLQLMGADVGDDPLATSVLVPIRILHAGDTLFHAGFAAAAIYFVRSGTFKIFQTADDGYEQVLGFAGRAEVLGFDALCMGQYPTAAVALEHASVFVVLVQDIFALAQRIPVFDRVLHLAVSRALTRRGDLADAMAAVAAEVRLARFLVQLSQRAAACGQSPCRFHLRMSRRDIASHLGVAHETVSRSFSALARWGLVRVDDREVEITDMVGIKSLTCSTRRPVDQPVAQGPRQTYVRHAVNEPMTHAVVG